MKTSRRSFFAVLAAPFLPKPKLAASLLSKPETLLVAAPACGNTLLTPDFISREALKVLKHSLVFSREVNTQYDGFFSGARRPTDLVPAASIFCEETDSDYSDDDDDWDYRDDE